MYAFASIADIVCMWAALTKFTHRNISNSHKFQAVGLGKQAHVRMHAYFTAAATQADPVAA